MIAELVTGTSVASLLWSVARQAVPPGLVLWAVMGNAPHLVYVLVGAIAVHWFYRLIAWSFGD